MSDQNNISKELNETEVPARAMEDIQRFYYKRPACPSKRSSLSLDSVLVSLLEARLGSEAKMRKWIAAQARLADEAGMDTKSISRAVQENAVRVIADPELIAKLPQEAMAEAERQSMMAGWLGQKTGGRRKGGNGGKRL